MSVEFRVGYDDHLVVADFLETRPSGTAGVVVDAHYLKRHANVVEAAVRLGIDIVVEPLTERMVAEGLDSPQLADLRAAVASYVASPTMAYAAALVEETLSLQPDAVTRIVPPHFLVDSKDGLERNLQLARLTHEQIRGAKPLRAVLVIRSAEVDLASLSAVARAYREARVDEVDLRITPLGGEDERLRKVRLFFEAAGEFREAGIDVIAGQQGAIGPTAVALGTIGRYSVGVGVREKVDAAAELSRQRAQVKPDRKSQGGSPKRVFVPGPDITVDARIATNLYRIPELRVRIACMEGACRESIEGPLTDTRTHYLHSRSEFAARQLAMPSSWRPIQERDRLIRSVEMRRALNKHLSIGDTQLPTRTPESLITYIDKVLGLAASA